MSSVAFIPELGTVVELKKKWTFTVHRERRNNPLLKVDGQEPPGLWYYDKRPPYERSLPKSTKLTVDRIYVRQGAKEYSSVTLRVFETTDPKLLKGKKTIRARFWVKLADFNNAQMRIVGAPLVKET